MTTIQEASVVVSSKTTSPTRPASGANKLLKLPNFDDITDLATQIREITDVLSRLLSGQAKWSQEEQGKLVLESSVNEFSTFCKAVVALLQAGSIASRRVASLLASFSDPECCSAVENFAKDVVRSLKETIFTEVSYVKQRHKDTTCQFQNLRTLGKLLTLPLEHTSHDTCIATNSPDVVKDYEILQILERLEAFWKVIGDQLSSVLEGVTNPPTPDVTLDAKNKWEEYEGYLVGAVDVLNQCSDALKVSADGLRVQEKSISGYVKRGFIAFWSGLIQRSSTAKPLDMTDQVHTGVIRVDEQAANFILPTVVEAMNKSLGAVMGWQTEELPSRFAIGSGPLRKLTLRIREQPVNLMITVHQSLEKAKDGKGLCRRGCKASDILLEKEDQLKPEKSRFLEKTVQEIKKSAFELKQSTTEVHDAFRNLRMVLLEIYQELDRVTGAREGQRAAFPARLSRRLSSKDVRTYGNVLHRVHDEVEQIVHSLTLITHWWQRVEFHANHLQASSQSSLTTDGNPITVKDIKNSFATLETYLDGYVDKIGVLYDENLVKLNTNNRKYVLDVRDDPNLVLSDKGLLEPGKSR